jgi:DNA invertase Pin-like site-specific DNA recombinase
MIEPLGKKIGYARVSTDDQNLDLQKDALTSAGCVKIFEDKITGSQVERKGLTKCFEYLRDSDTLVIWRLDRLGRSMKDLLEKIGELKKRNIAIQSIMENIDTATASGELILHIFASLAQFERRLIVERTNAGLKSARERGRVGGRPQKLSSDQLEILQKLHKDPNYSIPTILRTMKISRATMYKYLGIIKNQTITTQNYEAIS